MLIQSRPGRIPWTAVRAWCEAYGHQGAGFDFIVDMVAAMDGEFLAIWAERQPK